MISILVPVYNFDITLLSRELLNQLEKLKVPAEIIFLDDGSQESIKAVNRAACAGKSIVYRELDRNFGRIEIRNKLANIASFEWLLFIDCDSQITKESFIKEYISFFDETDAIIGGTAYQDEPPSCERRLHWKYGTEREISTPNKKTFRSNNFCIRKSLFNNIKIPTDLKGYGHEDTFIGIELERVAAKVIYIKNPVLHLGIDSSSIFIRKSENALENLLRLRKYIDEKTLRRHVTIYDFYCKTQHLQPFIISIYPLIKSTLIKNLNSCKPNLIYFDFYRLCKLINFSMRN